MAQKATEKNNHFNRKIYWLIFVLVFVLYGNSIRNNYALDDNYVTVTTPEKPNNPRIEKGIKGIPKLFTTHYVESGSQSFEYRPLVLVTFAIEYQLFGSNPHISHFISILLYAITCALLYKLLCRLFKNHNPIFPLLVVFLFILHPIHTEVVDNIKCRDELLCFLFGICSLYFFIKYTEAKKIKFIFLGILFILMSLLCKRTAILFIVLFPLTLYFFTSLKPKKIILSIAFPLIGGVLFALIKKAFILDIPNLREFVFYENPLYFEHGFLARIPMAVYTLGYYFKLLVFPYPLSCYYGYNAIPLPGWNSPFFIISLVFYVSIGVYACIKLSKKNILSYAVLIYLAGLFPFANMVQPVVGIVGDRFIYFASLGFCMAVAYIILKLFKIDIQSNSTFSIQHSTTPFKLTLVSIFLIYSSLVISRNTKWRDELTLYRNDIRHFANSCNLQYTIGNYLYPKIYSTPKGAKRDSIIQEAAFHYKQAIELMKEGVKKYPEDYTTINNIGTLYMNMFNDANSASPFFNKAFKLNPEDIITSFNIAFCYEKRLLTDSAIIFYEKTIKANTPYLPAYVQLHELYLQKQDYAKAIICDEKAVKQNPNRAQLYVNLGNAFILNKDTLLAVQQFEKAIEIEPANMDLRAKIAAFLKTIGYTERADKLLRK